MKTLTIALAAVLIVGCSNSSSPSNQSATLSINDIAGNWEADTEEYLLSIDANDIASMQAKFNEQEPIRYAPVTLHSDSVLLFFPAHDTLIPGALDSNYYGPDTLRLWASINHVRDSLSGIHGNPYRITFYRR